ncbi:serine protease snk-like [Arctopsyche grandis]|uniref:serine protease snk-like n=1 Tax=Arctopsyche grandis TaxID=121162 RepID=UPI00406D7305
MFKILALSLIFVACVQGQYAGERCTLAHDRSRGTCIKSNECQLVFDLLKCRRIKPTLCGFDGSVSVVCCPNRKIDLGVCAGTGTNGGNTGGGGNRPTIERISVRKCREFKECENLFKTAIVGGIEASPGEFPHMAAIGWPLIDGSGYAWNCGGSLISENFVLTAAHCTDIRDSSVSSSSPTMVRLGEHNIKSNNGVIPQDIQIAAIVKHSGFKGTSKYHDIALIHLTSRARFNERVKPICLWQSPNFPSDRSIATGWGKIGYVEAASDTLQKVDLQIIDQRVCSTFYKDRNNRKLIRGIISEQMCAGDLNGGKDTCQGDSGGPLQIQDPEIACAYQLIGVTSFGVGCGGANSPAVYTRISSYIDWIESVVWA